MSTRAPFRADIVGSFLRPAALKSARERAHADGANPELRAVEDAAITELVARQKEVGLHAVTDGEFRRAWWHMDFWDGMDGLEITEIESGIQFAGVTTKPHGVRVTGRVGFPGDHPFLDHFRFVRDAAQQQGVIPKFTIPSPTVLDFRLDEERIATPEYGTREDLADDLVAAYRAALDALYREGARYIQLDDTAWGYLCSEVELGKLRERGVDTGGIAERYVTLINRILADRPDDLVVTTHVCRGNFRSTWIASGGYEPVAEQLLAGTDYDGYFLEYDSDRAGGFEPLHFLPKGEKTVVLGLITSKTGELEDPDAVKRRIDEAAAFAPVEQLALSPQCGFASTEEGNELTEEQQWAKMREVVRIASEVWGD